eukprot:TRINITY_DN33261_c0_g1_i1.p1 TRINITY_DN33261_c0_g1~~TRINITY_DN33261_c0_g1_i1.p1  ORF type:complete len:143 (-),score=23.67 TRINITY_DN33261_c0_g1_i1:173-601(-)
MSLDPELYRIAENFGLPQYMRNVFIEKNVFSAALIANTFPDEEVFMDFMLDENGKIPKSMRMKMLMKMVFFEAVQSSRQAGQPILDSTSPASSAPPSREPSEPPEEIQEPPSDSDAESDSEDDIPRPPTNGSWVPDGRPQWR